MVKEILNFWEKLFKRRVINKGFSLMEILVAIVLLAVVSGSIGYGLMRHISQTRITRAKQDILLIEDVLDAYKMESGNYPTGDDVLVKLAEKGYFRRNKVPTDPWNNIYRYVYPGVRNEKGFDVYSLGSDETEGTNDDIGNWEN